MEVENEPLEKILNNACGVCFEKGELEKLTGDKGHSILSCINCGVKVHLRCYGDKNPLLKKTELKKVDEDKYRM